MTIPSVTPEDWIKWNVGSAPEVEYAMTDCIQNEDGVRIILENAWALKNGEFKDGEYVIVEIFFDGMVDVLQYADEGLRMDTWGSVYNRYGDKSFFRNWFLYKVENSKLAGWVEAESCGFRKAAELTHYSIVTSLEFIDVVCHSDLNPTITWRVAKEDKL